MRTRNSRFASILAGALVVLAGVTCTDSPTGPRSGRGGNALVGFAPAFSQAAAEIYRSLVNFRLEVDNIHVHLEHENGVTAKDTTVNLAAGQDSVVIELSVTLTGATETLDALIELRDGSTVLFSGTEEIDARAGSVPATSPPVELDYTGPGALARNFVVGPHDVTVIDTDSVTFQPSATDANGQNVSDIVVAWSVKDPARGTVDNAGKFKPSAGRGATYVLAALPNGLKDSGHVNIVPPATAAVVVSGGGQTGTVGKPLPQPIVIEAQASDNLPVPTATLTFAVTSGGGSLSAATAVMDANGRASLTLTLGNIAGSNTIEVAGVGVPPITVSATGTPDVASALVMSQQPSPSVSSGSTFPTQPKAQVKDAFGNAVAVADIPVTAALTAAGGRTLLGTLTVNTNASGVAEFTDLKISGPPGTTTLTFTAPSLASATSTGVAVAVGPPAAFVIVSGEGQGALPNEALPNPLVVKIVDAGGNGVASTSVTFSVTSGGGAVAGNPSAVVTADANGLAGVNWTVGSGPQLVTATVGGVTTTLHAYIAEKVIITNTLPLTPQSGVPMNPQPVVRLADSQGTLVKRAGIVITAKAEPTGTPCDCAFHVTGGDVSTTDTNGVATFTSIAVQGDIEQHGVVKFYRLIGTTDTDPNIAPGVSSEIAMQPGFPSQLFAEDFVEYHRMPAPTSTKTLAIVASDGYNNVPSWPIAFAVVSGPANCSITTPTTVNTDALGKASVNVATLASMSSCVVRAQAVFPPPPPCPECPPAEVLPPPSVTHKLYVAPDDVKIWTGQGNSSFPGPPPNWFGGDAPDGTKSVFIPAASQFANGNTPSNTGSGLQVVSLFVESGATFNLSGEPLQVTGDVISHGEIVGGGDLTLYSTDAVPHLLSGIVHALIKVGKPLPDSTCSAGDKGIYVIVGALTADDIWAYCPLQRSESFDVSVANHLRIPGPFGDFVQSTGNLSVGGNLTVEFGQSLMIGGTTHVGGELIVQPSGYLAQAGGSILVDGDATFDGDANLTDGLLELKKGFTHNGNCENQTFVAIDPHITRFTGGDPGAFLHLNWNAGCGSRFGVLDIATSGQGLALLSPVYEPLSITVPVGVRKLIIRKSGVLEVKNKVSIPGDVDIGSIEVDAAGTLRLFDIIPSVGCPSVNLLLPAPATNSGLSCTFKP